MEKEHALILLKQTSFLRKYLEVVKLLPLLAASGILDTEDVAQLKSKRTPHSKVDLLLEILPRRGPDAFKTFVNCVNEEQPHIAKLIAEEAGIELDKKAKISDPLGMEESLRILVEKKPTLLQVDADKILPLMEGLYPDDKERISHQETNNDKNEVLLEIMPRRSPTTLESYLAAVKKVDPKCATLVLPSANVETEVHLGSGVKSVEVTCQTPIKDVPSNTFMPHLQDLNKEHLLGDWRDLYKKLDLPPQALEDVGKKDNPVEVTVSLWMDKEGKKATVGVLLKALANRGAIVNKIEESLGLQADVDGLTVSLDKVNLDKRTKPVHLVSELRDWEKKDLSETLSCAVGGYKAMCRQLRVEKNPGDAEQFITACSNCLIRDFFRVLKDSGCSEAVTWLRKNLPAGSTGPIHHKDNSYVREMDYMKRTSIVKTITGYNNGSWERFAHKVGVSAVDIAYLQSLKTSNPMDEVLKKYSSRAGSTVGNLYDVFVGCELELLADEL